MEPSPELCELTRRLAQAIGEGDVAFLECHSSRRAGVAFLGTDPDERGTRAGQLFGGCGSRWATWKMVHFQPSVGVPNAEAVGVELSTEFPISTRMGSVT